MRSGNGSWGQDKSLFGETAKKSSDEKRCNAPCLDCVAKSCPRPSLRSVNFILVSPIFSGRKDSEVVGTKKSIHMGSGWVWGLPGAGSNRGTLCCAMAAGRA